MDRAGLPASLIETARAPILKGGLIWFTVWSSVVHALIMAAQGVADPAEAGHLLGDVPALLLVAGALAVLMPRGATITALADRGVRRAA